MEALVRAVRLSHKNSHIILLTDADCKDCYKNVTVINIALRFNIKIHFFFSGSGCHTRFTGYKHVQHATGGVSVDSVEDFRSLSLFIAELRLEEAKRSIRSTDLTSYLHKCRIFSVSMFTTKFEVVVNENSNSSRIYDPLGFNVKMRHISDELSGYISDVQPKNGSWRICTVNETAKFTLTRKDILDFSVDYYQDGHYSTAIPIAGMHTYINHVLSIKYCNK